MPNLTFSVYVTLPAILNIEIQAVPQPMQSKNSVIYPPLREAVLMQQGSGAPGPETMIGRAWGINWATPVTNRLNALGGSTNLQLLGFQCPSVDSTDSAWFATGSMDALTDPITITAPITSSSMYGRKFAVGDYVIWDDPRAVNGLYAYEIDRITAINGNVFTLSRSQQGSPAGKAYFGSMRTDHTNVNFYRMLDPTFYVLWDGGTQIYKFLWDKMYVSAVDAKTSGVVSEQLVNLFPIPPIAAALGLSTI